LVALTPVTPALARDDTRMMTCAGAQQLVRDRGAATLATSTFVYYRFVADRSECDRTQILRPAFAPTKDDPNCQVGYRCATAPGAMR